MVSGILVARLLGPEGRGQFAIAILWPSLIATVGSLGLREALTYEQARQPELAPVLTGHALLLAIGLSGPLIALGWVLIPALTRSQVPEVVAASLLFLWFIPTNLLAQNALGVLQGNLNIAVYNVTRLSVNVVYLVAILALWMMSAVTVWTVTWALLIANLSTALLAIASVWMKYGARWTIDRALMRRLFSYGVRNHLGSLMLLLNQRADQMLMALLIPPVQLGWYVAAVNISMLARLPSGAFSTLLFPKVTNQTVEEQRRITALYSRLNLTTTLVLTTGLIVATPLLVPLLYGRDYLPSIVPAEILAVGAAFVAIGQVWAAGLRGLGHPAIPAKAEMISLAATVIGLTLTLRWLGILGASLTSAVAYFIASYYMFVHLHRLLGIGLRQVLWPISLSVIHPHLRGHLR
ncbi:MAG: oligosaccharide flippase family protein [Anaerolineae bacterium]|nr:oligosaccharide flippase family protein [Anaerolineae bacterium]